MKYIQNVINYTNFFVMCKGNLSLLIKLSIAETKPCIELNYIGQ